MRVLMIQVGDPLEENHTIPADQVLLRTYFNTGETRPFLKSYIVNADTQMQSLMSAGIFVEYGYLGERKSIGGLWRAGKRMRRLVREKNINLVHVLWGSTTALMTVLMSPVPVVISFSGSDLLGTVDPRGNITKGGRLSRFISRVAALLASRNITKSRHMQSTLWGHARTKCTPIPNGVNLSAFSEINQAEARKQVGWENETGKIILFMNGANAPVKNLPLAEKIFEEVQKQYPAVSLKVLTHAPFDKMLYYYNAADLMLMCSFHEGSNNSIKEALACNLPIVSVNCGDCPERLEKVDNCFVLNTYDPRPLAEKALQVLKSNTRSNGRNFTHEVSIPYIAERIKEVYTLALKKS